MSSLFILLCLFLLASCENLQQDNLPSENNQSEPEQTVAVEPEPEPEPEPEKEDQAASAEDDRGFVTFTF